MKANVSSQYISALLLMATKLKNGLTLHLEGKITSVPYIKMTLSLLNQLGVETSFEGQVIQVKPYLDTVSKTFTVESDWSSASYFYSIVALKLSGDSNKFEAPTKKTAYKAMQYCKKFMHIWVFKQLLKGLKST